MWCGGYDQWTVVFVFQFYEKRFLILSQWVVISTEGMDKEQLLGTELEYGSLYYISNWDEKKQNDRTIEGLSN